MVAMQFEQVQRLVFVKKIFLGLGNFKQRYTLKQTGEFFL